MQHNTAYIIRFAIGICLVCALFVALSAVGLRERQEANILLDRQKKVLSVAGLMEDGQSLQAEEVAAIFASNIQAKVVILETGEVDPEIDPASFDQKAAMADPTTSKAAPTNLAKVRRIPNHGLVFDVVKNGELASMIIPIEGKGLWSTMYGFVALEPDANTISRVQFYEHAETAGLGSRITDPGWVGQFAGKRVYDEKGETRVRVVKGQVAAGSPGAAYEIDGISGATLTADGVTNLLRYWFGEQGFEPYLEKLREPGA